MSSMGHCSVRLCFFFFFHVHCAGGPTDGPTEDVRAACVHTRTKKQASTYVGEVFLKSVFFLHLLDADSGGLCLGVKIQRRYEKAPFFFLRRSVFCSHSLCSPFFCLSLSSGCRAISMHWLTQSVAIILPTLPIGVLDCSSSIYMCCLSALVSPPEAHSVGFPPYYGVLLGRT